MNRQALLLLALLVVPLAGLAAAAVWLLGAGSPVEAVDGFEVREVAEARVPDEPLSPSAASPETVPGAADDGELSSMEDFLEVVRTEEELPPDEQRPLVVQVIDAQTDSPVPEALVFMLEGYEGPELRDPFAPHWSTLAEDRGQTYRADEQGRVTLPAIQRWVIVSARGEGSFGSTRLGRRHRDVETVRLQPDETVRVCVVDGQDRPVAGVPVGLLQRLPERRDPRDLRRKVEELERATREMQNFVRSNPGRRAEVGDKQREIDLELGKATASLREIEDGPMPTRSDVRARALTSEDGVAVFRHFQFFRERTRDWWPPEHVDQFEAALMVPLRDPPTVAFAGRPVPDELLTLSLPPTARLSLRTVDRDGRPFIHPVRAEVRVEGEGIANWSRVSIRKPQGESSFEFPFVGLGVTLTARCRLDDDDFRWDLPSFLGPTESGESKVVDLLVAPDEGMLYGVLLDELDQPLVSVRPTFLINSDAGRLEGEEIITGPEGQFHLPYQVREEIRGPFRFEVRQTEADPPIGYAAALPMLPRDRVTDLGTLRVTPMPLLAEGRVIDDLGEPVERASIQLQRERDVGKDAPELRFVDEAYVRERTDEEGRFALYGLLERGRHRLQVSARDHFDLQTEDLRPGESLELVLDRESELRGTALVPDWMRRDRLRVVVQSARDPSQRREEDLRERRGRWSFSFDELRAGVYDLSIRSRQFPDPVLEVFGLVLEPGQQGVHPRLEGLDLQSVLFRFELRAVDELGQSFDPDRPLVARILRSGGQVGHVGFKWEDGRIEVIGLEPQLQIWPLASGFLSESSFVNHGASEVRFRRIPPLQIQVPGLRRAAGGVEVRVAMSPLGGGGLPERLESWDDGSGRMARWYGGARWSGAGLNGDDRARLTVSQGGPHRVVATLGRRSRGSRPAVVELGTVDVDLGARDPSILLRVDPAAVQAALEELAQRSQDRAGR